MILKRLKALALWKGASSKPSSQRNVIVETLEERTLYSADLLAVPPAPFSDSGTPDALPAGHPVPLADGLALPQIEHVFVDARVVGPELIVSQIQQLQRDGRALEVHYVERDTEGLSAISSVLSDTPTATVHIISHGSVSGFHLGGSWIDTEFVAEHEDILQSLRGGLTEGADILLYGCAIGESAEGQHLAMRLAELTGADIAASTNATGHVSLDADWLLEFQTGPIESETIATDALARAWEHELLTGTNNIDLLTGLDAQIADASDFDLIGNGGNDLLIANTDVMSVTIPGIGITFNHGDFLYDLVGPSLFNFISENDVTTTKTGVQVNSGSIDFILDGDQNLDVPGGGRAIVLQDAEITIDLPLTNSGTPYTLAFAVGGMTEGNHEIELDIDGQTQILSVDMPAGNTTDNMAWEWRVVTFNPGNANADPTPLTIKAVSGAPIISTLRLMDHSDDIGDFTLEDGAGNDVVLGGSGNDTVISGSGNDYIHSGRGADIIYDGSGNDVIHAGAADDVIHDSFGNDTIIGGAGDDFFHDGAGNDKHYGWGDNDEFVDGEGSDTYYGGNGNDKFYIYTSSPTDTNRFVSGNGDDDYYLKNHINSNFTISDEHGTDTLYLEYHASEGNSTYYFPDNFSLVDAGIGTISGVGATSYQVGSADYSNSIAWDLSGVGKIGSNISFQGGIGDDVFGIAFDNTEYRGGDGTDSVRVYGNSEDYSINRDNYVLLPSSDDSQSITISDGSRTDTISDTIEYIDFDDGRYDTGTGVLTDRPGTVYNDGAVPSLTVEHDVSTNIDISALNIIDSELGYTAPGSNTIYNFWIGAENGSISSIQPDGSPITASPPDGLFSSQTLEQFNTALNDTALFSYTSDADDSNVTDIIKILARDVNKSGSGGQLSVVAEIPVTILHDPLISDIEPTPLSYAENDPATPISSTITLTDPNTSPISSATVKIIDHNPAEDILEFNATTKISSSYNPATGTLSLIGDDSVASYETALRSITYRNTSEAPDTSDRTISIIVNDGNNNSNTLTRLLSVSAVNDAPTLTDFSDTTTDEDTELDLSFADLLTLSDATDIDGSINSFVVASNDTGTLRIGKNASSAIEFSESTNDIIDSDNNAYWTPPPDLNTPEEGLFPAFSMLARDNALQPSTGATPIMVSVDAVNDAPFLTTISNPLLLTDEDTEVEITLADLIANSDANDIDGSIESMLVVSKKSGELRLGVSSDVATIYIDGTNDTIDATTNAYWTPDINQNTPTNGAQAAFTVLARDNAGAFSGTPVSAIVHVNDINDEPTLSSFSGNVESTDEDTEVEITFSELIIAGNENDIDGTIDGIMVTSVPSGTLRIGESSNSASLFDPGSNDTIDPANNAYWTPEKNVNTPDHGAQIAFHVVVKDDDNAVSASPVAATIRVDDVNDQPIFTQLSTDADSTLEDTHVEITFTELLTISDASDIDGSIASLIVRQVDSGSLRIGTSASTATPYIAGTHDRLNPANNAYWTPFPDANTAQSGVQSAFSIVAQDNDGGTSSTLVTANVLVQDINDKPMLSSFITEPVTTDEDSEVEITLADLLLVADAEDVDGTLDTIVVKSLSSGLLRIGTSAITATSYTAGSNDLIDSSTNAYWTPALDQNTADNGSQIAFSAVVQDDDGEESTTARAVSISVNAVNDAPLFTALTGTVATTDEDKEIEISLSDLLAAANATDVDGTVSSFVVTSNHSGALRIGPDAGTATSYNPGSNDTIDSSTNAYWTAGENQWSDTGSGLDAFAVKAKDNSDALSAVPVTVTVQVNELNDNPVFTTFSQDVSSTDEDTLVEVTLDDLKTASDATDVDGNIVAFMIQEEFAGTLKIGPSLVDAEIFSAGTNDTINSHNSVYWQPDINTHGSLSAFTTVAIDDDGGVSNDAIPAGIQVRDINDEPTISTFTQGFASTKEDTKVEITFNDLLNASDASDIDGDIDAFIISEVSSGELFIGSDYSTSAPYSTTNNIVDIHNSAFWWPKANINTANDGDQIAFFALAGDDDGGVSAAAAAAIIHIDDVNDLPTLNTFNTNGVRTDEDTEIEITLAQLLSVSDAEDVDGDIAAFLVTEEVTGSLRIGETPDSATPFITGINDRIDQNLHAYWTPDLHQHSDSTGTLEAFSVRATDDDNALSEKPVVVPVQVTAVNDAPTLTAIKNPVDKGDEDTAVEISFSDIIDASNASDVDGTVAALQIVSDNSGTLLIGSTVTTATPYEPGINDRLDPSTRAYWTPPANQNTSENGTLTAFSVIANDNNDAVSSTPLPISVFIHDVNDNPTLTTLTTVLAATDEDTMARITFNDIRSAADEADIDGTVDEFVVASVTAGSLRIGTDHDTANLFATGVNDIVDAENHAFWTPEPDVNTAANGVQSAFTLLAKDNDGGVSAMAVRAVIHVEDVNDPPTFTDLTGAAAITDEDTEVQITLSDLQAVANESDIDGSVTEYVVATADSGSLRIGQNAQSAQPWSTGSNDTIDSNNHAFWLPDLNANTLTNGDQYAFSVLAKDNDGDLNTTPVSVPVVVNDVNDAPVLVGVSDISTLEDTAITIDLLQLTSITDSVDADGTITAYRVLASDNDGLYIGTSAMDASPFIAGTNDLISATSTAYWIPASDMNSDTHGYRQQLTLEAVDNDGASSASTASLTISVRSVNDAPTGTGNTIELQEDTTYPIQLEDIGFTDPKDDHQLLAVVVKELPDNGVLLLKGDLLSPGDAVTSEDIADGELIFVPRADVFGDSIRGFSYIVQDNGGTKNGGEDFSSAPAQITFNINAVNDQPQFTQSDIAVAEGGTLVFSRASFEATDVDDHAVDLAYTLARPPVNGILLVNGEPLPANQQFTQEDINQGRVSYSHSGSETELDTFDLSLTDGSTNTSSETTVTLRILEVIDPAPVIEDKSVDLKFAEPIDTTAQPKFSLLYELDNNYTVEIVQQPLHGKVSLQVDGNFTYRHDGSMVLKDMFTYRVINEDGVASEATVQIRIEPPMASAFDAHEHIAKNDAEDTANDAPSSTEPSTSEPTAAAQEELLQTGVLENNLTPEQKFQNNSEISSPLRLALANESSLRMDNDFVDVVIQHRQWAESRPIAETQTSLLIESPSDNDTALSDLFSTNIEQTTSRNSRMAESFDEQRKNLEESQSTNFEFGSRAVTVSSGLSIGYLVWLIRGGVLIGSVMSSLPAWRTLDPLPVLQSMTNDDDGDDNESLESLVNDNQEQESDDPEDRSDPVNHK